jgi:uncharacterized protein (DUF305 family)
MKNTTEQLSLKVLIFGAVLLFTACGNERATTDETTMEDADTTMETDTTDTTTMIDTVVTARMGGMMGHMHQHMQDMREMRPKLTGDPDYDYALMMTRHHQGGIRLSEEELANGTNSKLKEVANRTIRSNKEDLQKLQSFTTTHKPATGDTARTMQMMHPMRKMMSGMGHGRMGMGMDMEMDTTNVDQNYANMMIRHHQMGNEISRELLKMGNTDQMKQMAQKIINQQEKEIKELQAWQKQNSQK